MVQRSVFLILGTLFFASSAFALKGKQIPPEMAFLAESTVHIKNNVDIQVFKNGNWKEANSNDIAKNPFREYKINRCKEEGGRCLVINCTGFNAIDEKGNYVVKTALHCASVPVMSSDREQELLGTYDIGLYRQGETNNSLFDVQNLKEDWKLFLHSNEGHNVGPLLRKDFTRPDLTDYAGIPNLTHLFDKTQVEIEPNSLIFNPSKNFEYFFYFSEEMFQEFGYAVHLGDKSELLMGDYNIDPVGSSFNSESNLADLVMDPESLDEKGLKTVTLSENIEDFKKGNTVYVVGTGKPNIGNIRYLEAEIVDTFAANKWILAKPKNFEKTGKDEEYVCTGDSGGPVFAKSNEAESGFTALGNVVAIFAPNPGGCSKSEDATGYFLFVNSHEIGKMERPEFMDILSNKDEWNRLKSYGIKLPGE